MVKELCLQGMHQTQTNNDIAYFFPDGFFSSLPVENVTYIFAIINLLGLTQFV